MLEVKEMGNKEFSWSGLNHVADAGFRIIIIVDTDYHIPNALFPYDGYTGIKAALFSGYRNMHCPSVGLSRETLSHCIVSFAACWNTL